MAQRLRRLKISPDDDVERQGSEESWEGNGKKREKGKKRAYTPTGKADVISFRGDVW